MIYLSSNLCVLVHCHKEHGSKILQKLVTLQKEINACAQLTPFNIVEGSNPQNSTTHSGWVFPPQFQGDILL